MLRNHSHYSLLMSTSRSKQIASTCKALGYDQACVTDVATISGCVNFIQACKKEGIKPIIGCEVVLDNDSRVTLLCKNNNAWVELLTVISISNDPEHYDKGAKIALEKLMDLITPANFICIDGYIGSALFSGVFSDSQCIFESLDSEGLFECLDENYEQIAKDHVKKMAGYFGDNYFLEINNIDNDSFPVTKLMCDIIYKLDPQRLFTLPDTSSYYPERKDAVDHRVLVCTKLKTTMKKLDQKINEKQDLESLKFIRSSNHYIKPKSFLLENYEKICVDNLDKIVDRCGELDILSKPQLPAFQTPNGESEDEYLKHLCRQGWKRLIMTNINPCLYDVYKDRVLRELAVISKAGLSGYFLIVQDYVNHFRNQGCLIGPARGSGGGSLVCYLTGITLIDPIRYGLLFERFYNEGRNTKDHISLPDIDVDFPPEYRDDVISYLREKYGPFQVCQMLTFGRLAGRSILKEVLRVNESCSFDQMNEITKKIPNEASISDLLEEMDEPSVIRWALENDKNALIDYCWVDDDGNLQGEYAKIFEQAMRMEGIFKTQGKHAAGVVIASRNLDTICPMVKSTRGSEKIAGMEMGDLESIGCVKFDILGVSLLSKISQTVKDINRCENDPN
ncbi:MAG: PHP domain-containing protein [Candidatus Bathyarchaeota archaeon]|nr:PHP domain-containing protein [Candidatus Bathyarchaeota archaeon]